MSSISNQLPPPINSASGRTPKPPNKSIFSAAISAVNAFKKSYVNSVKEGLVMEYVPCPKFCELKGSNLTDQEQTMQTFDEFLNNCNADCQSYRRDCEFSRLN